MKPTLPTSDELSAFIDGELPPRRMAEIESLAAKDSELAQKVASLEYDAQQLRAALAGLPTSAPAIELDPARLRVEIKQRRQRLVATAASLVLALTLGITGGWHGRGAFTPSTGLPMADAVEAYRLFNSVSSPAVDLATHETSTLQRWLDSHFEAAAPMPDFEPYGFRPVGARLMATDQGSAAMVLYRDDRGETILFYVRPPGHKTIGRGSRRAEGLVAQYWADGTYHYAVVSQGTSPRSAAVQQAIAPLI